MSTHTIKRIAGVLDRQFGGAIDMSDYASRPEEQARQSFLSRALAALCIKNLALTDAEIAAGAVTDGFHDGGIDALYFDQTTDTLFIVQSKWNEDGNKPINGGGSAEFVDGARDLLGAKLGRFNAKIKAKEAEIKAALYCDRDVNIALITAHTAVQPIAPHGKQKIDDFVADLNNPVPVAHARYLDQASVYHLITADSRAAKISLPVPLRDWGSIDRPFMAYYGRVHLSEVAKWWRDYERRLCDRNLRHFFQSSDVNNALRKTLEGEPQNFWYFNNGITIICDKISKSLAGAPDRRIGLFNCEGVSVVNGAQTVGMIGSAILDSSIADLDSSEDPHAQAWVHVRIVSLESAPPGFDRLITRATNFQNAVGKRDFAALDPVQHRLATEFALD
jgi:AIPR protein